MFMQREYEHEYEHQHEQEHNLGMISEIDLISISCQVRKRKKRPWVWQIFSDIELKSPISNLGYHCPNLHIWLDWLQTQLPYCHLSIVRQTTEAGSLNHKIQHFYKKNISRQQINRIWCFKPALRSRNYLLRLWLRPFRKLGSTPGPTLAPALYAFKIFYESKSSYVLLVIDVLGHVLVKA
jgi:hypothetical protein